MLKGHVAGLEPALKPSQHMWIVAPKRRQFWNRLIVAVFLLTVAFWTSRGWLAPPMVIESQHPTLMTLVPRGQTYFYTHPYSNRYISDDTWRPPELFGSNQVFINKKHSRPHFHQELPQDHAPGSEKVLLLIKSSMATAWKHLPVHVLTTLSQFPNVVVYSDGADSVGGIEVIDIISHMDQDLIKSSQQLEYYRIHRSLRDKHVYVGPDQVQVAGGPVVDKFKHLPILLHAYRHQFQSVVFDPEKKIIQETVHDSKDIEHGDGQYDWYVFIDDNSHVFGHSLVDFLNTLNPEEELYLGSAVAGLNYVFAHGGSGIVLSRALMKRAFGDSRSEDWVKKYSHRAEKECCGDYMISVYLKELLDIELDVTKSGGHFQGNQVWNIPLGLHNWCKRIFTFHQQQPRDNELLWEYQRVKDDNLLYSDIYLDFVKPYFPPDPQKNWDNSAKDIEYSPAHPNSASTGDDAPYESLDNCAKLCERRSDCLMFRYDAYKKYCGLGISTVSLGKPILRYEDTPDKQKCEKYNVQCHPRAENQAMISGWYLQRVRSMRRLLECDPLFEDPESEGITNGALDQTEGWWLRAKERYGKNGRL